MTLLVPGPDLHASPAPPGWLPPRPPERSSRRPLAWRATLLGLLLLVLPGPILAGHREEFEQGRNAYLYGDYDAVIEKLSPLVEPKLLLSDPDDVARALELLGLSYFYVERQPEAQRIFERLIRFRPDTRLNPVLVPPPAVAFFDAVRETLADDIARERAALRRRQLEEDERRRKANLMVEEVEVRRSSRLVAVLPLGIGQFQNDQPGLGAMFLGTELISAGLSVTFFLMVEDLRRSHGRFGREDEDRIRNLQTAQLVTGGVSVGLMVIGAAHALWSFRERIEESRTTRPAVAPSPPSPSGPLSFTF